MKSLLLTAALLFAAAPAFAQVVEAGDAPDGVGGTQDATGAVTTISGTIDAGVDFADCYTISIADIDAFSANLDNADYSGDSQIFLLDAGLEGIAMNDDNGAIFVPSALPAGSISGLGLSPGDYILCVSDFDQDPVNTLAEEIFPDDFTTVNYPDAPSGDYIATGWNSSSIEGVTYTIDLTGLGATAPDLSITVNTFDSNPMRGESVFFRGPLSNNGGSTEFAYVYFTVDVPGVGTFQQNLGGLFLDPGQTINYRDIPGAKKKNRVPLPLNAPAGTYTVTIYVADDNSGSTVYDSDSFQFTLPPLAAATSAPVSTTSSLEIAEPHAAPNPFRDATEIHYALAETSEVDLRVFDVTGREVASLVSGTMSAGTHIATLRAGDLPGGTYIWRLAIGGEVTTGRVTLAR